MTDSSFRISNTQWQGDAERNVLKYSPFRVCSAMLLNINILNKMTLGILG